MFRKYAIPNLLDDLVSVTGSEPVEYAEKNLCCGLGFGHTIEPEQRHLTRQITYRKLMSAKDAGADAYKVVGAQTHSVALEAVLELVDMM